MQLRFTKAQGAGNDYLYLDCRQTPPPRDTPALCRALCPRRFGVGADGIILILPPLLADGDAAMRIFNADGSEAGMCGNGVRCVAEYLYQNGVPKQEILIDTPAAGRKVLRRQGPGQWQAELGRFSALAAALPAIGMGPGPLVRAPLTVAGCCWWVAGISLGNPHCVVDWGPDDPPTGPALARLGPLFERHPAFPQGVNTEFVRRLSPTRLRATVWERGSGATLACGTGAAAAVAAMVLRGECPRATPVTVALPGGELTVTVRPDDTLELCGPAKVVFTGEVETGDN